MLCIIRTVLLVFLVTGTLSDIIDNQIPDSNRTSSDSFLNSLLRDCKDPSIACVQKNVYHYFDETFQSKDVHFGFVNFIKNKFNYKSNDSINDESEARSSPIEEVAGALHEKATKFMYTHDVELSLPEFLFGGGVVKFSPRGMDGSGTLLKVEMEPKQPPQTSVSDPRIFKKIKKFFSNKLLMALMALLLVIKLLSMKFMFFLPMVMGVAAAKKLLLKILLFVFPVLSHLFKLCPYYQPTKYHHHHHSIKHLHQVPHLPNLHGIELDHPPPGWHDHGHHHEQHEDLGYYSDGPSFASDFTNHRKNYELNKLNDRREEANAIPYNVPGQGQPGLGQRGVDTKPDRSKGPPLTPTEIENMVLKAEKETLLKSRLQEEQRRVETENKKLQDQIKTALKLQEKLRIQSMVAKQTSKIAAAYQQPSNNVMQQQGLPVQPQVIQPQIVHAIPASSMHGQSYIQQPLTIQQLPQPQSVYHHHNPVQVTPASPVYQAHATQAPLSIYDSFYSPILQKIDKVLVELGFHEEGCRERLICSMYKNPTKFSPHSNLISAELSRDANELQKPTTSNHAVVRFYKYVQAARDGQDKRDCLHLYPSCSVVTE